MTTRSIPCPYCPRQFASANDLHNHMQMKRRISAAHGLTDDGRPRPRSVVLEETARVKEGMAG